MEPIGGDFEGITVCGRITGGSINRIGMDGYCGVKKTL